MNNTVTATVNVGLEPMSVAYDFGMGEIFLTNYGSDTVSVIADHETPSGAVYGQNPTATSTPIATSTPTATPTQTPTTTPPPTIIQEFPTWIILPLFAVIMLLSTIFIRKRISKKQKT